MPVLMLITALLLCGVLAAANGANDVSKGVATLAGAGITRYRTAIAWGVVATLLGSSLSLALAGGISTVFTKGVVATTPSPRLAVAVLTGAVAWVAFATVARLPVSTTHAILGAMLGAGLVVGPAAVLWSSVIGKAVLPLLLSVAVAYALSTLLSVLTRRGPQCVCLEVRPVTGLVTAGGGGAATLMARHDAVPTLDVVTGSAARCAVHGQGGRRVALTFNGLHWLTSAGASFARGLNDTPKIWAIGAFALVPGTLSRGQLLAVVAVGIAAGGAVAGVRVARQLGENIVAMSHSEGFGANLATAVLVGAGANLGMPMSITHVSTGSIAGIAGGDLRRLHAATLRNFVIAWTVTPVVAGLIAACAYAVAR